VYTPTPTRTCVRRALTAYLRTYMCTCLLVCTHVCACVLCGLGKTTDPMDRATSLSRLALGVLLFGLVAIPTESFSTLTLLASIMIITIVQGAAAAMGRYPVACTACTWRAHGVGVRAGSGDRHGHLGAPRDRGRPGCLLLRQPRWAGQPQTIPDIATARAARLADAVSAQRQRRHERRAWHAPGRPKQDAACGQCPRQPTVGRPPSEQSTPRPRSATCRRPARPRG
jgi:hypothetical protein